MATRFSKWVLLVLLTLTIATPVHTALVPQADVPDADAALAARFSDFGTTLLQQKQVDPAHFSACAAMLKAAAKLNPNDPRYPRLLVEAYLANGDTDGAIAALKMYRQVAPDDLGAQLQLIQLNLGKMETADAKIAYANQILAAGNVSGDVRSAVAVTAARLMSERGQQSQANQMLDQAIRLNPLNIEALRLRYDQGQEEMSEFQKIRMLIQMIRANPLQPPIVAELADRLADLGLVKPSLEWYYHAISLYQRAGGPVPMELAVDYGAEQFIAERFDAADGLAIQILAGDPNDVDALYLRLLCAKNTAAIEDDQAIRNLARKTLLNQLKQANQWAINPTTQPATDTPTTAPAATAPAATGLTAMAPLATTPPATGPATTAPAPAGPAVDLLTGVPPAAHANVTLTVQDLPDLAAALAKLESEPHADAKAFLTGALTDLAWYTVYFDPQAEVTAALLESLAKLLPADHVALVRLQGWAFLQQNKPDEAKVKLDAVADRDVLAALGLIKLSQANDVDANNRGRKLLSDHPSGMIGAFLKESLRDRGIKVVAREEAQQIANELTQFPAKWMNVIQKPQDFYALIGEPLVGQFDYREPLLVRVVIQNMSEFDITIGPDGVIRPDLWVDAQIRGTANQEFPGTAYDRVTSQLVLRSRQSVSQVLRVDQGALQKLLNDNPTQPHQIFVTVVTNPTATVNGGVGAGPGGYRVQLKKLIARAGFAVVTDRAVTQLMDNLVSGTIGRISNMDLMAAYIREAKANPQDERMAKLSTQFEDKLVAVRVDASPAVRGWSQYLSATHGQPAAKQQMVTEMSRNADWTTRLLAAIAAGELDADARTSVLTELTNDAEPIIKDYSAAMLTAGSRKMATTAPKTQP